METSSTPLRPLPATFAETRDALHQLAFFAIAPKRYANTERLGLRARPGGFGTPPWPSDDGEVQVRMEGDRLIVEVGEDRRETRPSTIREACEFLDIPYEVVWFPDFHDPPNPADPDAPLAIDELAATVLGDWFMFATEVLEELGRTPGATAVSEVQLWPEHFDPAREIGDAEAGQRASYGASPGDADHDEPYLYVSPWAEIDRDAEPFWNDASFSGASLSHKDLLAVEDPRAAALDFLRRGHAVLTG